MSFGWRSPAELDGSQPKESSPGSLPAGRQGFVLRAAWGRRLRDMAFSVCRFANGENAFLILPEFCHSEANP
ncbi:MAG: hypothetical protein PHH14_06730 [Candidatus Margulisbacteria bacterium]|nr:hypothetical protein [Candidatus Margulisiibacteriota bacterium]